MTPQQREKTFEDIVRQAHAERARVVGELLAGALIAVTTLAERAVAALRPAPAAASAPPSHAARLRQRRAVEARRGALLVDVGR